MEEAPHQQPELDLLSWISDLNSFGDNGQLPTSEFIAERLLHEKADLDKNKLSGLMKQHLLFITQTKHIYERNSYIQRNIFASMLTECGMKQTELRKFFIKTTQPTNILPPPFLTSFIPVRCCASSFCIFIS
jgi:hypothetical protein